MAVQPASFEQLRVHAVTTPAMLQEQPEMLERVRRVALTGLAAIHLRGHGLTGREFYEFALRARAVTREAGVPLIVNDRLDVALAVGADGLHLGRHGLPLERAAVLCRERGLKLGWSCHSLEEARAAVAAGADYLYLGTIFPSPGKPGVAAAGLEFLAGVCRQVDRPVFAIGGVEPDKVGAVARAGAFGVAAITAIWEAPDPGRAVQALQRALAGAGSGA